MPQGLQLGRINRILSHRPGTDQKFSALSVINGGASGDRGAPLRGAGGEGGIQMERSRG